MSKDKISDFPRDFEKLEKFKCVTMEDNFSKPKISKHDLRLGNMFEQGIVLKINGRTGAEVHLHGKLKYKGGIKHIESFPVSKLTPIPLSPKVLVDWCGGLKICGIESHDAYKIGDLVVMWYFGTKSLVIDLGQYQKELKYLHELQNLYYVLNKKELEIKE